MPGGGQVGLAAPPPPPPPNPAPIVVSVTETGNGTVVEAAAAPGSPTAAPSRPTPRSMRDHGVVRFEQAVDAAPRRSGTFARPPLPAVARLLIARLAVQRALATLPRGLAPGG
jgi:hypothetical protein